MINKDVSILIVDDMAPMRSILSSNLRTLGFENLKAVASADDAISILKTKPIHLVLTDWNMPVMNGLELLQWIRQKSTSNRFTPVIMVTAEVKREQVAEAISCGVTNFILKPFSLMILEERVKKALAKKTTAPPSPAPPQAVKPAVDARVEGPAIPVQPMQTIQVEEAQPVSRTGHKDERLTILAVDDVPDNLTLISNLFQKEYRVKIAPNGERAVKICESDDPPDIVLLDIMMPGMDGYEVIRHLKANELTAEIPVIFITALSDAESIVKGLEAGAVDYITKPIEPIVAQARVKNFLRFYRGYQELKDTLDTMMENAKLREDVEQITRHDMKGPIASIIGLLSAAVDEKKLSFDNIKMVEEEAYALLNMINLSTDLFKMETGRFVLDAKPVDIGRLIRRVTAEVHSVFSSKKLSIRSNIQEGAADPAVAISGDELLCYSLLHNLMKNAAEASPVEGTISINISDDDLVKLAIHNPGAVPESIRDRFSLM